MDITHDYIKSKFNYVKKSNVNQFESHFKEWISDCAKVKNKGTVMTYRRTFDVLHEFAKSENVPLSFELFDKQFENKFNGYLYEVLKLKNSTADRYIKTLKTFLKYASDIGINNKYDYLKYKRVREPGPVISLRKEELKALEDLDLSGSPILKLVRDCFCFCCHTGFRYGDAIKLKYENINPKFIEIVGEKGKRAISAPRMPQVEKYINYDKEKKGLIFEQITNQACNRNIKEVARLANLNRFVEQVWYRGKERVTSSKELYKIITFHMSKKTFITLKRNDGIPIKFIMAATGNRNLQNMSRYDEYNKDETFKAFAEKYIDK